MLLSFHNDQKIKDKYLQRLEQHRKADDIIQGMTGQDGKGCAVWCTLDKYQHSAYETELGVSQILARLEDRIFEGLSVEDSKDFPIKFLSAIPIGVDLTPVWKKFMVWLLVDEQTGVIRHAKKDETRKSIKDVADLLVKSLTEKIMPAQFNEVRYAAYAAAVAASAADAAAVAAASAAAAYAAAVAASAAAAYAAAVAASAADADADADADAAAAVAASDADAASAAAAVAASAAADADAKQKRYKQMADKLVSLLYEAT